MLCERVNLLRMKETYTVASRPNIGFSQKGFTVT